MIHASRIVVVVLGLAALGAGCKKEQAAPAAGSGSGSAPIVVDAAVAVAIDAPAAAALPAGVPADLPPFGPAAGADAAKARELAAKALDANRNGEEDPVPLAVAAVKADPGSPEARAALACVAGDGAFDLAQLSPLVGAAGCAACDDIVLNLGGDDCEWSDAVLELPTKVKAGPQRVAADEIARSLTSGDPAPAAPFFKAAKVTYVYEGKKKTMTGAKLLAQLTDQAKKSEDEDGMGSIVTGEGFRCAADCCVVDVDQIQHNHDFLQEICFGAGTDQLTSIELTSGD